MRALLALLFATTTITAGIVVVVDGDTVRANGQVYRLVGFDTPESGEPTLTLYISKFTTSLYRPTPNHCYTCLPACSSLLLAPPSQAQPFVYHATPHT